eukprot:360331-Chlamydomonas_euryale.AAC.9
MLAQTDQGAVTTGMSTKTSRMLKDCMCWPDSQGELLWVVPPCQPCMRPTSLSSNVLRSIAAEQHVFEMMPALSK